MAALSLALLASALGLIIEGNTTCPTPEEVGGAVRPLLREEISGTNDRLVLSQTSHELKIRLLDSRGNLLAARVLPLIPSCEAQAHRVAVIAAAWQAELSDEPLPPAPEVKMSEEPERGARLWPEPAPPARPTPGYFEMGLRLSYVPVGGLTTGVQLGGGAVWGRWGIEGSGWLELSRSYDTDQKEGQFFRIAGEFGPTLLVRVDQPEIQLRAQGVASALLANNGVLFDPGVEIGARLLFGHRPASGFLDATVTLWPQLFTGLQGLPLSPLEVFLTVGLILGGS
jgi:hypothetical protein